MRTNIFSLFFLAFFLLFFQKTSSQEEVNTKTANAFNNVISSEVRGKNAISLAGGTAIANGDYPDAIYEVFMHLGYKRFIGPYVNINLGYNKYSLAFKDEINQGFMSFDANFELVPFPKNNFSPFLFAGGGLNATNYFTRTDSKIQGGAGFEILVSSQVGVKLFAEYNMTFTDELDGKIYGAADDTFWRAALGLHFYFGRRGSKRSVKKNEPTVINSNPIIQY